METNVYNSKGEVSKKINLPEHLFGLPWNSDLVHQVAVSMASSARNPIAHAKTRGEVRGGGKKPWQQKGTGRARHGSTRSPIWVGGGTTHGPRNDKNYDRKVNKKMKAKALFTILSRKLRDGEVFFVDSLGIKDGKTKDAVATIKGLSKIGFKSIDQKPKNALYLALGERDEMVMRSLGNVNNVSVQEARNMSVPALLQYKAIVIVNPDSALAVLGAKLEAPRKDEGAGEKPKKVTRSTAKKVKAKTKATKAKKPAKAKK